MREAAGLGGGVVGVLLDFLNLKGVAVAVVAHGEEPLVAVEVAEGDVGPAAAAEVGDGVGDELDGAVAGGLILGEEFGGVRPAAGGADGFGGLDAVGAVGDALADGGVLAFGESAFGGVGGAFELLVDGGEDAGFDGGDVFETVGDGPAAGGGAEVPLGVGEAGDEGEEAVVGGAELVEEGVAFGEVHGGFVHYVAFGAVAYESAIYG